MKREGNAIVYCEESFNTPYGKTAHGLVRRSERYRVLSVIDSRHAGADAGQVLDDRAAGIPVQANLAAALDAAHAAQTPATHFVIGLAPDGGRLPSTARQVIKQALAAGLHVDSGLHDFLSEDPELTGLAAKHGATIRDVRKPPARDALHFFTGKIEEVTSFRVALLGTDSAVGKRTTAWLLVDALRDQGISAELIGTGQTAWLQGARYSLVLDSLVNDFVSGEIEHVTWSAWKNEHPDVLVLEGQGSLMNPAYPGGFELLAAGRPHVVLLQHAPSRRDYDGFPGYPIQPLPEQIAAIEMLSGKPVVAITLNHEGLDAEEMDVAKREIHEVTGLPVVDPLREGAGELVAALKQRLPHRGAS